MTLHRRRILIAGAATATGLISACNVSTASGLGANLGTPAPDFSVPDAAGKSRTLAEFAGKPLVLEWTSPSCPFVRAQYASGSMQALQGWCAARSIAWLSVLSTHPSRADFLKPADAADFNRSRSAAPTALLMDTSGTMGRAYGARTTPHMFVVSASGTVVYMGAIDDRPTVDKSEVSGSHNLVRAALEDVLAGHPVRTATSRAYGCTVGYQS